MALILYLKHNVVAYRDDSQKDDRLCMTVNQTSRASSPRIPRCSVTRPRSLLVTSRPAGTASSTSCAATSRKCSGRKGARLSGFFRLRRSTQSCGFTGRPETIQIYTPTFNQATAPSVTSQSAQSRTAQRSIPFERVEAASKASLCTCWVCGQPGEMREVDYWYVTLCEAHLAERKKSDFTGADL